MKRLFYMYLFLSLNLLFSCTEEQKHKFGYAYNQQRSKLGIPIIEDEWLTVNKDSDSVQFWGNLNEFRKNGAWHHLKVITKTDSAILNEEDHYIFNEEGRESYILLIKYSYKAPSDWYRWNCRLTTYEKSLNYGKDKIITLKSADSVLNSWGLKRQIKL